MFDAVPLSLLKAFEAASRTGSFRNAADELARSPSAISHAIRTLEGNMGISLFVRTTRKIHLTAEGEFLYQHVRRAFEELRHGIETVSARGPTVLRLHSAPSFAAQWLAPRLSMFFSEYPLIDLKLAASTNYVQFGVDECDIDITYGRPKSEGAIVIPLGDELLTPLCSPAMAKRIRQPMDLTTVPLIQSEYKQFRWPSWFEVNGLPVCTPQGARFDRSFLAIAAACDGLGVALESTRLAERELRSGRLVRPLEGLEREIHYTGHYLAFSHTGQQRYSIRIFQEWLLAELGLSARGAA